MCIRDRGTRVQRVVVAVDAEGGEQTRKRERRADAEFVGVAFVLAACVHEFVSAPDIDLEQFDTPQQVAVLVTYLGHHAEVVGRCGALSLIHI